MGSSLFTAMESYEKATFLQLWEDHILAAKGHNFFQLQE
jgi:hypothetical protein